MVCDVTEDFENKKQKTYARWKTNLHDKKYNMDICDRFVHS